MSENTHPVHPLDPCSAEELSRAVAILRDQGELSEKTFFSCGFPAEPPKELVAKFEPGDPFDHCLHARATSVDRLGSDPIAHVAFGPPDSGALDFRVRVADPRPINPGDRLELTLAVDKIHYFDALTGDRI